MAARAVAVRRRELIIGALPYRIVGYIDTLDHSDVALDSADAIHACVARSFGADRGVDLVPAMESGVQVCGVRWGGGSWVARCAVGGVARWLSRKTVTRLAG